MLRFFGSGDIKEAVREHLAERKDLCGQRTVDVPAGKGEMSLALAECGAEVEAFDLFPEAFEAKGLQCRKADLCERLPLPDGHADLVLCQEAIEHMQDPLGVLEELARILKPGGSLLLTTPNISHLRGKLSRLLIEGELYNRLPPSETDAVWFEEGGRRYLGHVFLIDVQRLRVLSRMAGFRWERVLPVKVSTTSLLLGFLYPLLALANGFALWRTRRRAIQPDAAYGEIVRLNLHPTVLFGKHLFVELVKESAPQTRPVRKDPSEIR